MTMENVETIASAGWIQRWAGSYTFISCSYWGHQYHTILNRILGVGFDHTLFIHKEGTASFYIPESEFRKLGQFLAGKVVADHSFAKKYCGLLKTNTDILLPIMKQLQDSIPSWDQYSKFLGPFENQLAYHVFVKKTIDFLPPEVLDELLPLFKDARLYSESIYSETERFFRNVTAKISEKEGIKAELLTCLTGKELETYLQQGTLPETPELEKRYVSSALYFEKENCHMYFGGDVSHLEEFMTQKATEGKQELHGIKAFPGIVKGQVRVVPDPFNVAVFNEGDVLVTGMTRPEFMPLIQKASAIVTEAGGILCHAAITARELKKPCIVGTQVATKVLKDGDLVEVDADKGVVRVLENKTDP